MDGKAPSVKIIRFITKQIEKLTIHKGGNKVKGAVRIRNDNEQRRLAVAQGIELQFVILHKLPQLLDIEGSKSGAAGNEDGF